jgi:HD-like signal output (HDOD) protein
MEECFLAGLMHDIGKTVMGLKFPERYGTLVRNVYNEGVDGMEAELELFGFDHAMVGEALLHAWNLPRSLGNTVRWHHDPAHAPEEDQTLTAFVALGNQLALDRNVGIGKPEALHGATGQALAILDLAPEALDAYRLQVVEALETDKDLIREF